MNKRHWIQMAVATTAAGLLVSTAMPGAAGVSVGDEVAHSFSAPVLNGMGVNELLDLRGKPVLVEFWGTR